MQLLIKGLVCGIVENLSVPHLCNFLLLWPKHMTFNDSREG